jgi:hypothetical protein
MDLRDMSFTEIADIHGTDATAVATDRFGNFVFHANHEAELRVFQRADAGPKPFTESPKPVQLNLSDAGPLQSGEGLRGCAIDHERGRVWVSLDGGIIMGWDTATVRSVSKK